MNISEAARILGGHVNSPNNVLCPGPAHKSPADRSLSVMFTEDGMKVHSFAGDDWRQCLAYVQLRLGLHGLDDRKWRNHIDVTRVPDQIDKSALAWEIWNEAIPIKSTPVEAYLIIRGIGNYQGTALRWHRDCPYGGRDRRRGCMLAAIVNLHTGRFQAIQRTPLAYDGEKVGERMTLGPSKGGIIKLVGEAGPHLAIAEGMETALSLHKIDGMASVPVWSAINAAGVGGFPLVDGVETLWVIADHDNSGLHAARSVSEAWVTAGRRAYIIAPKETGLDLNDVIRRARFA